MLRDGLPTGVVTFLLSDVEGSTTMWELRREVMGRALALHDQLIESAVTEAGGRVLKARGEGDSTFAVFERPTQAIRAAIDARRALQSAEWPDGCRLEVRFAIHAGEVEARDGDYYGTAVNRAGRIRGLAVGGQILVSQAVSEMVTDHLPDDALLVAVGEHELRGLNRAEHISALVDARSPVRETIGGFCPYKGLLAFQPEDDAVFFGREAMVAALAKRLLERRRVVVVGASGSGKSSILRAGVLAAFRRGEIPGDWSTAIVTPGEHPVARLDESLDEWAGRRVLAIDQMEELFTACDDAGERAEFVARVFGDDDDAFVIATLRADFFGHCASVPGLAEALSDATVLVGPMDETELRRAIEAPAELAGLRVEPGLVDVMLQDLGREPGSLPLLAHALLETWRRREARTLTLTGYQESGGVRGAIARTAESVWNDDLDDGSRPLARRIFLRLTELGDGTEDTRRRVRREELLTGDPIDTDDVLRVLVDRRLVTVDDDTVEVAHEALIREWPRLRSWLDDDREGLRIHRHLTHAAEDWEALGKSTSELYRGPRLAAAREWLARDKGAQLNQHESAFLTASEDLERAEEAAAAEHVAAQGRANRRLRRLLVAASIMLVVALLAGAVAFTQRGRANRSAKHSHAVSFSAEVDRAVAEVPTLLETNRVQAALLAVEAYKLRPDAATKGALLSVAQDEPRLRYTLSGGHAAYAWMEAYPDGRRVVAFGREGGDVWDMRSRRKIASFAVDDGYGVALSRDGSLLATGDSKGNVAIRDANTLKEIGPPIQVRAPVIDLAFSADGKSIAVAVGAVESDASITDATTTRVWSLATHRPIFQLGGHTQSVNAVALSHDGKIFATGGNDDRVVFHDAGTGATLGAPIDITGIVYDLAFSPDDGQLAAGIAATGGGDNGAVVVDTQRRTVSGTIGNGTLTNVGFTNDGRSIIVAGDDTRLIDAGSLALRGSPIEPQHGPMQIADLSGIGIVLSGFDGTVSVWVPGAQPLIARAAPDGSQGSGVYSPDGKRLLISADDGTTRLYSVPEMHLVAAPTALGVKGIGLAVPAAFSPDSRTLALADVFGRAYLFDATSGKSLGAPIVVNRKIPQNAVIVSLTFSPDGRTIAALSPFDSENGARLIDVSSRKVTPFSPAIPHAFAASFRPDGKEIAVTSGAGGGAIFAFAGGNLGEARTVAGDTRAEGVAYSPDGHLLTISSQDGTLMFFDAGSLRPLSTPLPLSPFILTSIVYSADSRMLVVQDIKRNQHLVDVRQRARIGPKFATGSTFGFAGFSADGRSLILPSTTGTQIWNLNPANWSKAACSIAGRSLTREEWDKYFSQAGAYQPACAQP